MWIQCWLWARKTKDPFKVHFNLNVIEEGREIRKGNLSVKKGGLRLPGGCKSLKLKVGDTEASFQKKRKS